MHVPLAFTISNALFWHIYNDFQSEYVRATAYQNIQIQIWYITKSNK